MWDQEEIEDNEAKNKENKENKKNDVFELQLLEDPTELQPEEDNEILNLAPWQQIKVRERNLDWQVRMDESRWFVRYWECNSYADFEERVAKLPSLIKRLFLLGSLKYYEADGYDVENLAHLKKLNDKKLLEKADLRGVQFNGLVLREFSFLNSLLNEANFKGADLLSANFKETNLTGVNFEKATLNNADFTEAVLANMHCEEAVLNGANFTNSSLKDVHASDAFLVGAHFTNAELINIYFTRSDLSGADFTKAHFQHVDFKATTLIGTIFINVDLFDVNFSKAIASAANFKNISSKPEETEEKEDNKFVENQDFCCDFSSADLTNANFSEAFCYKMDFRNAIFTKTLFDKAIFVEVLVLGQNPADQVALWRSFAVKYQYSYDSSYSIPIFKVNKLKEEYDHYDTEAEKWIHALQNAEKPKSRTAEAIVLLKLEQDAKSVHDSQPH